VPSATIAPGMHLVPGGLATVESTVAKEGKRMMKAAAALAVFALSLVTACTAAPATPAPTPVPTAKPAEVKATKPEHLAGIWQLGGNIESKTFGGRYYRWDPDGTVWWAEDPEMTTNLRSANYCFEDGVYYEGERPACLSTGSYEIYLQITEGRAVRARYTVIEDPDPPCETYRRGSQRILVRVD
jgi:hypothetical protein